MCSEGESILVCDRDRVIARIDRVNATEFIPESEAEWLNRLEQHGVVRRGTGKLSPAWVASRPAVDADVVAALLRERTEAP